MLISLSRSARCDYSMMVSYYSIRPSVLALWTVCKLQVLHAQDHPDDAFREPQWFRGGVVRSSYSRLGGETNQCSPGTGPNLQGYTC